MTGGTAGENGLSAAVVGAGLKSDSTGVCLGTLSCGAINGEAASFVGAISGFSSTGVGAADADAGVKGVLPFSLGVGSTGVGFLKAATKAATPSSEPVGAGSFAGRLCSSGGAGEDDSSAFFSSSGLPCSSTGMLGARALAGVAGSANGFDPCSRGGAGAEPFSNAASVDSKRFSGD